MELGKCIKVARVIADLDQAGAAKKMDMTSNYLSLIENNHKVPIIGTIKKITKVLDIIVTISKGKVKAELGN